MLWYTVNVVVKDESLRKGSKEGRWHHNSDCGGFSAAFYILLQSKNCAIALAGHRAAILFNRYLVRYGKKYCKQGGEKQVFSW